jgi:type VI secretion system protein ImpH
MFYDAISRTFLGSIEKDIKAEVIAAEMVEHGIPADLVLLLYLGGSTRPFRKDVGKIEDELLDYDRQEYVIIKALREGLYDMLPEAMFHQVAAHKSTATEKEIIQAMRQRQKEERDARTFFLPFEAGINHLRILMALYENRLDKRKHYNDLVNIFSSHWTIFQYLDERQADIFLHLIPVMHDLRDDYTAIEKIMEMMFLLPVKITLRQQAPYQPFDPIISLMDESSLLGVNLTTGNAVYVSGEDEILITIGPMHNSMLKAFIQGGTNGIILELLSDYLLPAHVDLVTEFALDEGDKVMRLADGVKDYNCVLGEETYL